MTQTAKAILKRALALDPVNRAELIEALFRSFDRHRREEIDAAWAAEAESRLDAHAAGKISADKAEAVLARIGRR